MFERFTDRARKVMAYANQEAQRLNHEYIACEHLFLGILKEGSGVASNVLRDNNINLEKARQEVQKLIPAGPEMICMGKLPQTPRAKKALEYAIESARDLNHNYVGTEHILLGILREKDNFACEVLKNLGLQIEDAKKSILRILGDGKEIPKLREIPKLKEGLPPVSVIKIWAAFIGKDKIAQGVIAYSFDEALEKVKRYYKDVTGLTEVGEAII